ncbi:MAG: divalent metal cation transporter [Pseudomonadota bacterium]
MFNRLGPGLLFAGAAIGTSHFVQSTRAGALYGLGFVGVIIFANLIKYPAFRFGPYYAATAGETLIVGYARLGPAVVPAVAISLILVQAIIIAATSITTAGILLAVTGVALDARLVAVGLIVLSGSLVFSGGYRTLDGLVKWFVVLLALATIVATLGALPHVRWEFSVEPFQSMDAAVFVFAVAVMGFMPSGLDLSILHSLWGIEKAKLQESSLQSSLFDFNVGYVGSALLALCFLLMGAGVMYGAGAVPASASAAFAGQVINLYTASLGGWAGGVVGIAALAVMFSTLLAVMDGMPRMQSACFAEVFGHWHPMRVWFGSLLVMSMIAIVVLLFFMSSFTTFIDFVTITSFIVGPFIAGLNHLVVVRSPVAQTHMPSLAMRLWSLTGIALMLGVCLGYGYLRLS